MIKRYLLLSLALMVFVPSTIIAQDAKAINKLSLLGVGARALALNCAYTAIANDYSATFWNPAGIGFINSINAGGMHSQMSLKRTIDFVAVTVPLSYRNYVGISWAGFKIDEIEARAGNSPQPDYLFSSIDRMLWVTYSRRLTKQIALGLNAKFMQYQLSNSEAMGRGIDVGVMFNPVQDFRLSFVSQDISAKLKWDTGKIENFERIDRLGFSYKIISNILLSADLISINNKTNWTLGTEVRLWGIMKIRSGLQHNIWAFGTGLTFPLNNNDFVLINYTITTDALNMGIFQIIDVNILLF